MTNCPFHEKLHGLLADELSGAECERVARHVEGCASCQELLAQLSESEQAELGCRNPKKDDSLRREENENNIVNRLKSVPPWAAAALNELCSKTVSYLPRSLEVSNAAAPEVPGYELLGELGRGGMGIVYQARQIGLKRIVALKMIRARIQSNRKELARFRAEAAMLARLDHPNIVKVYDVGDVSGRPYFVLEYVSGGSLAQHIDGSPQPPRMAAKLINTLARAIHAAHSSGVIHRDLKPANILLHSFAVGSPSGKNGAANNPDDSAPTPSAMTPKITDFGVAKCVEGDAESRMPRGSTVTGELLGTPNYMAPEQAVVPRQPVSPATDVYALGAILFELLTGRPPFVGETPLNTIWQVLHDDPPSIRGLQPGVPQELETICLKCLRKKPEQRYASALELAEDIQRYLRDEPIRARPVSLVERSWRWMRRRPLAAGILVPGLLGPIVAFIALSFLSIRLVRSSALESAAQQAEVLEEATQEYSRNVQRVVQANFPVNKTVPPTPGTVPLSIPPAFLHDLGEQLHRHSRTGMKVRQFSDFPFPGAAEGGPQDEFERKALARLRETNGQESVHEFTEIDGQRVVRYAQARIMRHACVECHNTHSESPRKDWREGDVRGALVIIRPIGKDEARVTEALSIALLLSAAASGLLLGASMVLMRFGCQREAIG